MNADPHGAGGGSVVTQQAGRDAFATINDNRVFYVVAGSSGSGAVVAGAIWGWLVGVIVGAVLAAVFLGLFSKFAEKWIGRIRLPRSGAVGYFGLASMVTAGALAGERVRMTSEPSVTPECPECVQPQPIQIGPPDRPNVPPAPPSAPTTQRRLAGFDCREAKKICGPASVYAQFRWELSTGTASSDAFTITDKVGKVLTSGALENGAGIATVDVTFALTQDNATRTLSASTVDWSDTTIVKRPGCDQVPKTGNTGLLAQPCGKACETNKNCGPGCICLKGKCTKG